MPIPDRAKAFCARFNLDLPILLAPMAGASAPTLSAAIINAGGLGSCGVLLMKPDEISDWAAAVRSLSDGPFQLNIWILIRLPFVMPGAKRRFARSSASGVPRFRSRRETRLRLRSTTSARRCSTRPRRSSRR